MDSSAKLVLVCGGMFAAKTEYLAAIAARERRRKRVVYYKVNLNGGDPVRAEGEKAIRTHSGRDVVDAYLVSRDYPILRHLATIAYRSSEGLKPDNDFDILILDEVQFLSSINAGWIVDLVERYGKTVYAAGLDMDYTGHSFDTVAKLACHADEGVKLKAVCHKCGIDATYSIRVKESNNRLEEGSQGDYVPACRWCFREVRPTSFPAPLHTEEDDASTHRD